MINYNSFLIRKSIKTYFSDSSWSWCWFCSVVWQSPPWHQAVGTHTHTSPSLLLWSVRCSAPQSSGRCCHGSAASPSIAHHHPPAVHLSSITSQHHQGRSQWRSSWLERRESSGGETQWEELHREQQSVRLHRVNIRPATQRVILPGFNLNLLKYSKDICSNWLQYWRKKNWNSWVKSVLRLNFCMMVRASGWEATHVNVLKSKDRKSSPL